MFFTDSGEPLGSEEPEGPPPQRSGTEIKQLLENWKECSVPGKAKGKKQKMIREEGEEARRADTWGMEKEVRVLGFAILDYPRYASLP